MAHDFRLRVYYEDTDLAGIVYYANYLKFIERGRTEALIALGIDQASLRDAAGLVFAVRRVEIDYLAPARFQDDLVVSTSLAALRGARVELVQTVSRAGQALALARVVVVAMRLDGRPARLPPAVREAVERLGATNAAL